MNVLIFTGPQQALSPLAQWGTEQFVTCWRRWLPRAAVRSSSGTEFWSLRWGDAAQPWQPAGIERLHHEGYLLSRVDQDPLSVAVAARTEKGFVNGLFGLLAELGCAFYLGGEAIPARPWRTGFPADWRKVCNPRMATRGLLPWHNFANSPTTWDLADYVGFFDCMAAQQMNCAIFHSYDYEPHGAYRWQGHWAPAEVRRNHVWHWPEEALEVKRFPEWARGKFAAPRFGPPAVLATTGLEECITASQGLFRQALEHARNRGIQTCVGFELIGNPKVLPVQQRFLARLEHLATTYHPDYLGLWEPEAAAQRGWPIPAEQSGWRRELRRDTGCFRGLPPHRVLEALRLAEFVKLAHTHLRKIAPRTRLVLSGWGGDRWMRLPDFFAGLHRLLPRDVVFAALDNLDPTVSPQIAGAYADLPPDRQRWPIVWPESDSLLHSSQWHAPSNVSSLEPLAADAVAKGCQGLLGIHWRSSVEIEAEIAYLARSAWEPIRKTTFWADYTRRCYGPKLRRQMSAIYRRLDRAGPGWTGLSPQIECDAFGWEGLPEIQVTSADRPLLQRLRQAAWAARPVMINRIKGLSELFPKFDLTLFSVEWALEFGRQSARKRRDVAQLARSLRTLSRQVRPAELPTNGRQRLEDLIRWIDFSLGYAAVARLLKPGGAVATLLAEARWHSDHGAKNYAATVAKRALGLLRQAPFERAIRAYAARVRTQSQRGNLARMCRDAWPAWQRARETLEKLVEEKDAGSEPETGG